jgi:hypothetical protein
LAAQAWDVNILIWTSRKSVCHKTNDRFMVHGEGTRADGRRSSHCAQIEEIVGSRVRRPAPSILGSRSNVVGSQAGYLASPATESPETQIYFINHRSGTFPVPRVRTVVCGERASRSIVNRTTVLWSIWIVSSLILAGLGSQLVLHKRGGPEVAESRGSYGSRDWAQQMLRRPRWTLPPTNGRKRT